MAFSECKRKQTEDNDIIKIAPPSEKDDANTIACVAYLIFRLPYLLLSEPIADALLISRTGAYIAVPFAYRNVRGTSASDEYPRHLRETLSQLYGAIYADALSL